MFRQRRAKLPPRSTLPVVVIDPTRGDDAASAAMIAASSGDRERVERVLRGLTDLAHLDFVLELVTGRSKARPAWLEEWLADDPDDPLASTAHGVFLVNAAWEHRTRRPARELTNEQIDGFLTALREAEPLLRSLVDAEPRNAPAWRALIDVSRGLDVGIEEQTDMIVRCSAATPLFVPACRAYLQSVCPKWGGSVDQVLAFARATAGAAPDGHPALMLIADAHIELSRVTTAGIVRDDAVLEVRAALERSGLALESHGNDPIGLLGKNVFAVAADALGDHETAQHMLALIGLRGDRIVDQPWAVRGDPATRFVEAGNRRNVW